MNISLKDGLSTKQMTTIAGAATLLVIAIPVATFSGMITRPRAGILMDALLTVATLGYVFLTYGMVSQMRRDVELRERHQNRPHVIERLESDLLPLHRDLQRIKRIVKDGESDWNGPNLASINGKHYRSFHESNAAYSLRTIPRFTTHIDLDNGVVYDAYRAVGRYDEAYEDAVFQLQELILEELDDFEGDSDMVRSFAVLGLKIEDANRGTSLWDDHWKDDVVQLRDEMPEEMQELTEARDDVTSKCGEVLREINPVLNQVLKDYGINEAELDSDSGPDRTRQFVDAWK